MITKRSERRLHPVNFVLTNKREYYWLEDHKEMYNKLLQTRKERPLTNKEEHLFEVCLQALREHDLVCVR